MGTSRSPAELSRKLGQLSRDYADMPKGLVSQASLDTKRVITSIAPARLRGAGRRGARLSVAYNVIGAGTEARSLVFARGPWQLIESDTQAHQIPRARGRRSRARYAVVPGRGRKGGPGVFAHVSHPGTQGQHPWRKGVEVARPLVGTLFRNRATLTLRRIF